MMEFSKKVVVWAVAFVTASTLLGYALAFLGMAIPERLIGISEQVITVVIACYMAKAGAENVFKIKRVKE